MAVTHNGLKGVFVCWLLLASLSSAYAIAGLETRPVVSCPSDDQASYVPNYLHGCPGIRDQASVEGIQAMPVVATSASLV